MILANGATPLQALLDLTPEPGMVDHRGFVLAQKGKQFVTWECGKDADDLEWHCESGHYFDDLAHALYDFGLRTGRDLARTKHSATVRGMLARMAS